MKRWVLCSVAVLAACGGPRRADTVPNQAVAASAREGNIVPPEKMDEVEQNLKRRGTQISHCLAVATEKGEVRHGTRGRIAFAIRIGTGGRATQVDVIKTDLHAQSVVECATQLVKDTSFPTLPRPYETSYTYGMEAN